MKKLIILSIGFIIILAGCGLTLGYSNIGKEEYQSFLDSDEDYVYIDVRTPQEFEENCLDDIFINIDSSVAVSEITSTYEKDTKIVLVCRSGNRSSQVAKALSDKGYTNIYNVETGLQSLL